MAPLELPALLQVLLAAVLAGAIGLERQLADESAGLRTHILVGIGAATFGVLTAQGIEYTAQRAFPVAQLAQGVATGIGFLGAGAILRGGSEAGWVRGLATAASLWLVAAVALAAAWSHDALALFGTVLGVAVLRGVRLLEVRTLPGVQRQRLEVIAVGDSSVAGDRLVQALRGVGAAVRSMEIVEAGGTRTFTLRAEARPRLDMEAAVARLHEIVTVTRVTQTR